VPDRGKDPTVTFRLDDHPPSGEWTVEELDEFPEDNRLRELVEGSLILRPSSGGVHPGVVARVFHALDQGCPAAYDVIPRIQVRFSATTVTVPDVVVTRDGAAAGNPTWFAAEDVLLAAEIVDSGSVSFDRVLKPALYAAAGIAHYWRVEIDGAITVHTYRLDAATGTYRSSGIFTEMIKVDEPWRIAIPIAGLRPRNL
jgi:Uma2 family endonuclease